MEQPPNTSYQSKARFLLYMSFLKAALGSNTNNHVRIPGIEIILFTFEKNTIVASEESTIFSVTVASFLRITG